MGADIMRLPKKGTLKRAVFDAQHARWCGGECGPSCNAWLPDADEINAIIKAVEAWNDEQVVKTLAKMVDHGYGRVLDTKRGGRHTGV